MGPVELVLDLVEVYRSLDSISQVYSLVKATSVSVRLWSNSYRLRSANKLSGAITGKR